MEFFVHPGPWYVSGPLLGILVPQMFSLGPSLGVSRNVDSICSILGAEKFSDHFKFNLKDRLPSLILAVCAIIGDFLAVNVLSVTDYSVSISSATVEMLNDYGIPHSQGLQPDTIFNWAFLASP